MDLVGQPVYWGRHQAFACVPVMPVTEDIGESHGPTHRTASIWEEHETQGGFLLSWEVGQQSKVGGLCPQLVW